MFRYLSFLLIFTHGTLLAHFAKKKFETSYICIVPQFEKNI